MIYSILKQKEVQVFIQKHTEATGNGIDEIIKYDVYDNSDRTYIGCVKLEDTKNGVKVQYIRNQRQDLYKRFGHLADQIEVEHCLKRGLDKPYIQSVCAKNAYIQHFLRGKRFISEGINIYFDNLTKNMVKGEKVITDFLGYKKMYMPVDMLNKIKDNIKLNPLLKKL